MPSTLDLTRGDRGDQMETVNRPDRLHTISSDRGHWGDRGDPDDHMETRLYQQAKAELQRHLLDEMDAITTRTKIKYTEEGEKSTRYFYSLENHQKSKQTIKLLTKNNLDTITETRDIITETYDFYKDLYSASQINPAKQTDFLNIATPTLKQNDRLFKSSFRREGRIGLMGTIAQFVHFLAEET